MTFSEILCLRAFKTQLLSLLLVLFPKSSSSTLFRIEETTGVFFKRFLKGSCPFKALGVDTLVEKERVRLLAPLKEYFKLM
jgi:hypothetical protein